MACSEYEMPPLMHPEQLGISGLRLINEAADLVNAAETCVR